LKNTTEFGKMAGGGDSASSANGTAPPVDAGTVLAGSNPLTDPVTLFVVQIIFIIVLAKGLQVNYHWSLVLLKLPN
jgi:hypothetical protein